MGTGPRGSVPSGSGWKLGIASSKRELLTGPAVPIVPVPERKARAPHGGRFGEYSGVAPAECCVGVQCSFDVACPFGVAGVSPRSAGSGADAMCPVGIRARPAWQVREPFLKDAIEFISADNPFATLPTGFRRVACCASRGDAAVLHVARCLLRFATVRVACRISSVCFSSLPVGEGPLMWPFRPTSYAVSDMLPTAFWRGVMRPFAMLACGCSEGCLRPLFMRLCATLAVGFRDAGFKAATAGPRAAAMTTNMWLMALAGAFAVLAQVLAIKYVTGSQ